MAQNIPADFIPDAQISSPEFIPDSVIPNTKSGIVAPDFIPDDQFMPDDIQLADKLKADQTQQKLANYEKLQSKYGDLSNQALAGLAGAARGLSLGTSDVALVKSGLASPETLQGLSEANPLSSGAGQLLGGAGLVGATGGAGALAEGAGLAGRLGASALEGGAFGAGNAVSDYAMGDPNLNAQKIAAHIGTGALFGAGLGALGESIKAALPPATEALKSSLSKLKNMAIGTPEQPGLLESVAPNWAEKFNVGLKSGEQSPSVKARELIKNLQDLHNSSKKAANALYEDAAPANISEALKDMPTLTAKEYATSNIDAIKNILNGTDEITDYEIQPLSSLTSKKIINTAINNLEVDVSKAKSAYDVQNSLSNFAKDIDSKKIIKFDTLPTASQMADQEILLKMRNQIRDNLKDPQFWGDAATHYSELSNNYSAYKNSLKNFQSSFMKREIGPQGAKRYIVDPGKVSTFFNKFDNLSQDLRKQYLNDFIENTSNLADSSENYHGFVKGAESISDHVAALAAKNEELNNIAQIMSANGSSKTGLNTQGIKAIGAHMLGIPDPVIGAAIGASKAYQSITNPYQLGSNLGSVFTKLKTIGDIVNKTTRLIESEAKSIFSSNTARAISSGLLGLGEKQYTKHAERIQNLATNPSELADHLDTTTKELYNAAPNISTGLHSTITMGLQFLYNKLPKPNNELPLNAPWKPTPSQKSKFNKYFQAVNDPLSALKQIKNGSLSNETMEALQTVHPELLKNMQQLVISHMNPKKIPQLNYSTKISLSKFLGQPLESSMLPQVLSANQNALSMPSASNVTSDAKQRSRSTLGGLKQLGLADRSLTRTQQLQKMDNK